MKSVAWIQQVTSKTYQLRDAEISLAESDIIKSFAILDSIFALAFDDYLPRQEENKHRNIFLVLEIPGFAQLKF